MAEVNVDFILFDRVRVVSLVREAPVVLLALL